MHGDKNRIESVVITKDDYDKYNLKNGLFLDTLRADLVRKTFLFIGFSFEDPNIGHILSQIKNLIDKNVRQHYCVMKRITKEEDAYNSIRQELHRKDLKRYGINVVYIDDYPEIANILKSIEDRVLLKNIFISGSYSKESNPEWCNKKMEKLSYHLSRELVKENYKVISGFGLGVGSSVVNGALDEIYEKTYKNINNNLVLRPFPQSGKDIKERWSLYRNNMISDAGVCIFMFGNKLNSEGEIVNADGMIEEFEIAKKLNKFIIPIGSTGDASKKIWDEILGNINDYQYLEKYMNKLGDELEVDNIIKIVTEIIKEINL